MSRGKSTFFSAEQRRLIGRRIRELRGFDLSQAQFAELLGVTQTVVSRLERGAVLPTAEVLVKLSRHSGKTVDWILKGGT